MPHSISHYSSPRVALEDQPTLPPPSKESSSRGWTTRYATRKKSSRSDQASSSQLLGLPIKTIAVVDISNSPELVNVRGRNRHQPYCKNRLEQISINHEVALSKHSRRRSQTAKQPTSLASKYCSATSALETLPYTNHRSYTSPISRQETEDACHFSTWIAQLVLVYTMKAGHDAPQQSIPIFALDALASRIQLLWISFNLDQDVSIPARADLAILALWYLQLLSPKGFIEVEDLSSEEGVLTAMRLFLVCWIFANQWISDYYRVPFAFIQSHAGGSLEPSTIRRIQRTALQALDHNLYVSPTEFDAFRVSLWLWTKRVDVSGPTNLYMQSRLQELCQTTPDPGSSRMQVRATQCPSDDALGTLHRTLLQANPPRFIGRPDPGLWCPAEDEIVRRYGRNHPLSSPLGVPWPCHSPNTPDTPQKLLKSFNFYSKTGDLLCS